MRELASYEYLFSKDRTLTCSWTQAGPDYRPGKDWMFVGQAPNGWGDHEDDGVWLRHERPPRVADLREYGEVPEDDTDNLLQWVEERGDVRRGFWSVIRWLVSDDDDEWAKGWSRRVAWTNLYKISPQAGGNPDDDLCEAQFDACRELLRIEVETYDPALIVFLTGMDWARSFVRANFPPTPEDKKEVLPGTYLGRQAFVAPHPRGAMHQGVGTETLAEQILVATESTPRPTTDAD